MRKRIATVSVSLLAAGIPALAQPTYLEYPCIDLQMAVDIPDFKVDSGTAQFICKTRPRLASISDSGANVPGLFGGILPNRSAIHSSMRKEDGTIGPRRGRPFRSAVDKVRSCGRSLRNHHGISC
jgi:hypothetical protein